MCDTRSFARDTFTNYQLLSITQVIMDSKSKSSHETSKVIPNQLRNKMMEALSSALCLDAERILRVDIKRYSYDELIKMKNALEINRIKKSIRDFR